MHTTRRQLDLMKKAFEDMRTKCGGEGSGRPGPCPSGESADKPDPNKKLTPTAHVSEANILDAMRELRTSERPAGDFPVDMMHAKLKESNPKLTLTQTMESLVAAHNGGRVRLSGLASIDTFRDPARNPHAVLERDNGVWYPAKQNGKTPQRRSLDSNLYFWVRDTKQ